MNFGEIFFFELWRMPILTPYTRLGAQNDRIKKFFETNNSVFLGDLSNRKKIWKKNFFGFQLDGRKKMTRRFR